MSHTPPVPEANQSPYPIQEPPHPHVEQSTSQDVDDAEDDADLGDVQFSTEAKTLLGVGAAVGLGAIATVAALLLNKRGEKNKPRKTARKAPAKRAPRKKAA